MISLFGQEQIRSISFDQSEILCSISDLHCGGHGFECDPTYNIGGFYRDGSIPKPQYRFDINPQSLDVTKALCEALPLPNNSLHSLVFDPPFLVGKSRTGKGVMDGKYSSYPTILHLKSHYRKSIIEFSRVLKRKGILVFKCQDSVSGRRNYFNHVYVYINAVEFGFRPIDLFVLLAKNRPTSPNHVDKQFYSRKYHCYFWVFKKK